MKLVTKRLKQQPASIDDSQVGARRFGLKLIIACAGGAGVFLAFPRFDLAPLAWITLVPILWSAHGATGKQHFLLGWLAGIVTNLGGFYWICGMLMDFGHMAAALSFALTLLLAAYQGLVFGLWLYLLFHLRRISAWGYGLLAPLAYVVAEALVYFIFPWYYGNSQYWMIPFIQICELGGVPLLSFLLVMTNGFLMDGFLRWREGRPRAWLPLAGALSIPLLIGGYGLARMTMLDAEMQAAPHLTIGLVEADVGIWEKEDRMKIEDNLVRHQRMSIELEKQGAQLIVWPETSYWSPMSYARIKGHADIGRFRLLPREAEFVPPGKSPPPMHAAEDAFLETPQIDRVAPQRGFSTPLLFGSETWRENPASQSGRHPGLDLFNTAMLLDKDGKVLGAYDKVYLLIFGEHIPLGEFFPQFYNWLPESSDLTPGESVEVLPFGAFKIGVMVCYEDIIPAFTRKIAAKKPNILINVTNDAWFGKTSEPYLHLALSVFRAVESRVALVRSTNTGVSAFIDPAGRILSQTNIYDPETLLEKIPMMEGGSVYQTIGGWPVYLCIGVIGFLFVRIRIKQRKKTLFK
jgi:apolipoprotein N-acyltransferase